VSGLVALPLLVVICATLVGASRLDRLRPAAAARSTGLLLAAVLAAAIPTMWLLGFGGLANIGLRVPFFDWCRHLLPEGQIVGATIGLLTLGAAVTGSIGIFRVLSLHVRLRSTGSRALRIIDSDAVFACTLPGPAATIALSRGLCDSLDAEEFALVVAHEESHARHRHDRLLLIALLTRAFVAPLASTAQRLEFYVERWADEEAVQQSGAARTMAARTIAKVALAGVSSPALLGMAHHGTAARAVALLQPASSPTTFVRMQAILTTGLIVGVAALQLLRTAWAAAELVA